MGDKNRNDAGLPAPVSLDPFRGQGAGPGVAEESLEGMNAFLQGRKPDFQKFRMRNKRELADYLDGCAKNLNAPPSMRRKQA